MWFDLQRRDPDDLGPQTLHFHTTLPIDAGQAFALFADADAWPRWFPAIEEMSWLTPEPHGVGSLRRADLRAGPLQAPLSIIEHFTRWQPPQGELPGRMTFFLTRASLPLASHFVEDTRFTPDGPERCTLDWWVHLRPRRPLQPLFPLFRPRIAQLFEEALGSLPAHLSRSERLAI